MASTSSGRRRFKTTSDVLTEISADSDSAKIAILMTKTQILTQNQNQNQMLSVNMPVQTNQTKIAHLPKYQDRPCLHLDGRQSLLHLQCFSSLILQG